MLAKLSFGPDGKWRILEPRSATVKSCLLDGNCLRLRKGAVASPFLKTKKNRKHTNPDQLLFVLFLQSRRQYFPDNLCLPEPAPHGGWRWMDA